jgi:hypothetical protein
MHPSAVLTALASLFIGLTVLSVSGGGDSGTGGAIAAVGVFAFSPLIWQYAVTAEVFPLNTFFAALLLYLVVLFQRSRSLSVICAGAFLSGLALCNQHTIILYELPLVAWILFLDIDRLRQQPHLLALYACLFFLGLSLYLYLPIAATLVDAPGGWGHVKTISGLVHHMLRRDYGTFQLYSGAGGKAAEGLLERCAAYVEDLVKQGLYVAPALSLLGAWHWCRNPGPAAESPAASAATSKKKDVAVAAPAKTKTASRDQAKYTPLAICFAQCFYFAVFHSLSNLPLSDKLLFGIHQRFWMQPNVLTFICFGVGFNAAQHWLWGFVSGLRNSPNGKGKSSAASRYDNSSGDSHASRAGSASSIGSIAVAALLILAQYHSHADLTGQADNTHFNAYARAILEPLPPNAVLLVNYDMQWTAVRYMQQCEGVRRDVTSINLSMMTFAWFQHKRAHYPNISFPGTHYSVPRGDGSPFSMYAFLEANRNKSKIFLVGKLVSLLYGCGYA